MGKAIVGINYKNKNTGQFDGRTYNYYCEIDAKVGDLVKAPTAKGFSTGMVTEVNVPESRIDMRILPILKTITEFAESEDERNMSKDLIVVKQLPVIEEQLRQVKENIENRVSVALSLVCNEDTYKEVKRERAELSKEYRALEARRIEVKKAIMAPYLKFEELYKSCAGDIYSDADAKLKKKIDEVEDGIKGEKAEEIHEYFSEYTKSKNIDFIKFEDTGINITMSASKKSLKEKTAAFIDKVAEDLGLIETQEHKEEILVEYKKSLNIAQAITSVSARKEAIENERQRREAMRQEQVARAEAQKKVEAVIEEEIKIPEPSAAPIEVKAEQSVYETSFKVLGTIEQLKALKNFLEEGGYKYEQL